MGVNERDEFRVSFYFKNINEVVDYVGKLIRGEKYNGSI